MEWYQFNKKRLIRRIRGQSIVEILVVTGLLALFLPALLTGLIASRGGRVQEAQRSAAIGLLRETEETLRSVREKGWINVATNGTYYPHLEADASWSLVSGTESINGFSRSLLISDVYRNSSSDIVTSSGSLDPSTKKIDITISWSQPYSSSVTSTLYLHRFENQAFTQSSAADFNAGFTNGTTVTNESGGEVTLGGGGGAGGDWCAPNLSITALDLPKNGVANAITAIEGHLFAGTGENASGVSFANVNVTNANPPVASINGTFNGYKTNGVFGEANYAYLATDTNSKEVVIVNLTTNPPTESGYFDVPGNGSATSIFVTNNKGYVVALNKLYIFDLTAKTGSRTQLGVVTLAANGTKVIVNGTYAYVSLASTATQLQIVDVAIASAPTVVGQAIVSGQSGQDIFINSSATRAYLATTVSTTQREFFIIDISTKTGNRPTIGSYDSTGMSPKAVTVVTNNKAILVGSSGEEYQAINIANEASPTRCGGINIDTGVNGVASVVEADGDAYSYIITGDATTELKIIQGGPNGSFSNNGTFTSAVFNAGNTAVFNRFQVTTNQPVSTTIQYQVAVADAVSGSCASANYVFVGPDGTTTTYYSGDGLIPFNDDGVGYENPGQCFKYKAYFSTSDFTASPTMFDFTVNYSP